MLSHRLRIRRDHRELRKSFDPVDVVDCIQSKIPFRMKNIFRSLILLTKCCRYFRLFKKYRKQCSQINIFSIERRSFSLLPSSTLMYGERNQQSISTCPNRIDAICLLLSGIYYTHVHKWYLNKEKNFRSSCSSSLME